MNAPPAALRGDDYTQLDDRDLQRLLLIRHFELGLLDAFGKGKLNGTTHTCVGQEYIPVALGSLLSERDFIFSAHRGHGYYLALFDDPIGLLAEIMGKQGAVCRGVGGSQHIYRRNRYLSTGVQGESMPVAVGVALHMKRQKTGGLVVVSIGDGTWGEGSVYEALNMAQLWRVPLLVVVENNGIAQTTPTELQMAGSVEARARAFGLSFQQLTTFDVNVIRRDLAGVVEAARAGHQPAVVEFMTVRVGPHSKGDDTRNPEWLERVKSRDWYLNYRRQFPEQVERVEAMVLPSLAAARERVENSAACVW